VQARPNDLAGVLLSWDHLLTIVSGEPPETPASRDAVLRALTLDPEVPVSVLNCVTRAREGARTVGSRVEGVLPVAMRHGVAAFNWGLVAGKTQTYLPWDSWQHPYVISQPTVWFHEVFRNDGTPYRQREVDLFRQLTGRGIPNSASKQN